MKAHTLSSVFVLASGLQLASAGWTDAAPYTCPSNTNDYCNSQQSSGFDWGSLSLGSFSSYGDFNFNGWSCDSSFSPSKRDLLTGRGFQPKCITGSTSSDTSKCPSFGCGSSKSVSSFSISEFQVSVEFDCDLEFHYSMPGGTTCKQKSSCKKEGSTITNSQCGGASSVSVVYPSPSKGAKSSCSIGVHSISFHCGSPTTTPQTTSTTAARATTTLVTTTKHTKESKTHKTKSTTTAPGTTTSTTALGTTTSTSTSEVVYTTSSTTAPLSSSTTEAVYTTTEVVITTTTVCPVTTTHTTGGTTSVETGLSTSTVIITSTATVCTECEGSPTYTPPTYTPPTYTPPTYTPPTYTSQTVQGISTSYTAPSAPSPTAPCPNVLPQCLNTWIFSTGCSSNTDTDCLCPSSTFVATIFDCISAYGASSDEIFAAQTYFQGICANYIPGNPAIVTCASSISSGQYSASVPVTTVQVVTTLVVPCTETTGISSGSVIPYSSTTSVLSTAVTVPQVVFQTYPGSSSSSVALAQGTPAPASYPTGAASPSAAATVNGPATTSPIAFAGAGSRTGMAFGTLGAAMLLALIAV